MNEGHAVILAYGILGASVWVWFTRHWSVVWRVLPVVVFALIWLAFTVDAARDSSFDPDLGVRLSSLAFGDAAIWTLPLSLAVWASLLGLALVLRRLFRSRE